MRRTLAATVIVLGLAAAWPSGANAAFLATCPQSPATGDRVFAIDGLSSGTVTCFDYGTGNSITGGASDTFLAEHSELTFFDYDGPPNQPDNSYFFTINPTTTTIDSVEYAYGTFNFGSTYTSTNTTLYLGFKVGSTDPTWAVFALTGFTSGLPLTGTWYTTPKQGGGVSHSAIYGQNVPPDVVPDPVVPEPTSLVLLGSGLTMAGAAYRKRKRASK